MNNIKPVTALQALALLALTNSPSAWQHIGFYPKCSRKCKRNSPAPTDLTLTVGLCPGEQTHHLCAHPWQLCVSAGRLKLFGGGDTLLCLLAVPESVVYSSTPPHLPVPVSLLSFQLHTTYPHWDSCVIPHQTPPSQGRQALVCRGASTCQFWSQKPGPASLGAAAPWCTRARTAHQQLPSSAKRYYVPIPAASPLICEVEKP